MPRPVQLTSPLPTTLITGFGGLANTNLLPTLPSAGSYAPFLWNPPVAGTANLGTYSSPVIIGTTQRNNVNLVNNVAVNTPITNGPVALNRNLIIHSIADVSGGLITLVGKDANHQPVTETIVGPGAGLNVTTANFYAYLDSFSCYIDTATDNFNLTIGLELTTCPIRIDFFYPNSSYAVAGQVIGTGVVRYDVFATVQKVTLFSNEGIAYTNPTLFWTPLDATLTNATTDIIFSTSAMRTAVYLSATLTDANGAISFTVVQQGVR
jgi:hypothetical protein